MHINWIAARRDALDHALACAPLHLFYLHKAVRDEGCACLFVSQGPERFDMPGDKPAIVLIGDDLACALGPTGFHEEIATPGRRPRQGGDDRILRGPADVASPS